MFFRCFRKHFDSNLKSVIYFSFFFIRPKSICKLLKQIVLWCIHCTYVLLEEFFIELSFLFTEREECFRNLTTQRCAVYQLACCSSEEKSYQPKKISSLLFLWCPWRRTIINKFNINIKKNIFNQSITLLNNNNSKFHWVVFIFHENLSQFRNIIPHDSFWNTAYLSYTRQNTKRFMETKK